MNVELADFGCPRDLDRDDFDDDVAARDQLYHDADAVVQIVVDRLGPEPADPLAVDARADYGSRCCCGPGTGWRPWQRCKRTRTSR